MRVLKNLFLFFFGVSFLIVITIFVGREVLMYVAIGNLKNSLRDLQKTSARGEFVSECLAKGIEINSQSSEFTIQLRFISSRDYVVEVLCDQSRLDPIHISKGSLPSLVKKLPGQSGFIWGTELSGVFLEIYGKKTAVYIEDEEIYTESNLNKFDLEFPIGPRAECVSYGFSCCVDDVAIGQGDQMPEVFDCPKSCYSYCQERPAVLSFSSMPVFESGTRKIMAQQGLPVTFAFLVSDIDTDNIDLQNVEEESNLFSEIASFIQSVSKKKSQTELEASKIEVTLNFGDGQSAEFNETEGVTEHTYICTNNSCNYEAYLQVKQGDIVASDNVLSRIEVVVN